MKAIFTLVTVLFFTTVALAQDQKNHGSIETTEVAVVLDSSTDATIPTFQMETIKENQVARLYKFKNSRVKKALTFTTAKDKAKLA